MRCQLTVHRASTHRADERRVVGMTQRLDNSPSALSTRTSIIAQQHSYAVVGKSAYTVERDTRPRRRLRPSGFGVPGARSATAASIRRMRSSSSSEDRRGSSPTPAGPCQR